MKILRKEMLLKGYTSVSLAAELKKDPSNISSWLLDKYKPNAESVKKLKLLGFSDTACLCPSKEVDV